ncbi:MAG: tryptophan--tRNA ligase [Patescibacteria group bacterium]|nr:tryptophan--tRNA ligase [Patescibacteria group bacterium]MDE2438205.1 tryptophan--tRNA ligase [Patescibacteria group bacterium]
MKNKNSAVLTGDRPTGTLHLGHLVGSIQNRIALQDQYDRCFYMVADIQALTDNADNPEKVRNNVFEVTLDNLAAGVSPQKTTFFIQSQVPEIAELTVLLLNLVTLARLKRNPTVKDEMKQKGFGEDVPAGFLAYPVSQAADILFCGANLVPVGEDQLPVIEQANEIVLKFNALYGETFQKITPVLSTTPRLVGIDGNAKASKSLNNTIFLNDSFEEIQKKVMMMYTDPEHIHASDSGNVGNNVVFTYLDIFDPKKNEVRLLKEHYTRGGLGDVEIKKRLIDVLEHIIAPIRTRRRELERDPDTVMDILKSGTKKTRVIAQETMRKVRKAVKINYFD